MTEPRLETIDLILRPLTSADYAAVHAYASWPDNVKYVEWGPNKKKDTLKFLRECEQKAAQTPRLHYDFGMLLRPTQQLIGACGLYLTSREDQAEAGWILHKNYWSKGYMTQAINALLAFGFMDLSLHRIMACCNAQNIASARVMEKAGMRKEAHQIKARFGRVGLDEVWYDVFQYAILNEEWKG